MPTEQSRLLEEQTERSRAKPGDEENNSAVSNGAPTQEELLLPKPASVIPFLFAGAMVSNLDSTLVFACAGRIASQYQRLSSVAWLVTSYTLLQCAFQPIYGRLSQDFGRRNCLIVAFSLLGIGCAIVGVGAHTPEYAVVLLGRAISGIGGAGGHMLITIVIGDLVPPRNVGAWYSYFNIFTIFGRMIGGPLGGWITDGIGWEWAFWIQVPLIAIIVILTAWRVPRQLPLVRDANQKKATTVEKLARQDFLGSSLLVGIIIILLLWLQFSGSTFDYFSISSILMIIVAVALAAVFVLVENHRKEDAVIPLSVFLHSPRVTLTALGIGFFQMMAQGTLVYIIPLYFQISQGLTVSRAATAIVPTVVASCIGSLYTGWHIGYTLRFKALCNIAVVAGCVGYFLIILRWNGNTGIGELLYTILGGAAGSTTITCAFTLVNAGLKKEKGVAITLLNLAPALGILIGISVSSKILVAVVQGLLSKQLVDISDGQEIIARCLEKIDYVQSLDGDIKTTVVKAYIVGFRCMFAVCLIAGVLTLPASLLMPGLNLGDVK